MAAMIAAALLAMALAACGFGRPAEGPPEAEPMAVAPHADEASGRDWAAYGRTFSEQRFSPLAEIDTENVSRLGLVWSLLLPDVPNVSTVPLAVDGVIYFAAGYSVVHAVDALSGELLWKYDPRVRGFKMRFSWGSRGLAYWNGKLYAATQDGRLFAVDAQSGNLVWEVQTTEPGDVRYITGAPRVFDGKVAIGHAGADAGPVRGYVTAYDAETGEEIWRFHTVPGDPSQGFENDAMEMAAATWTGEWWRFGGGGTVWNAMTYDPEFDRIYLGTGNGTPWNQKVRSPGGGDNLFLCSIVALDADTGEYAWHYQVNPGETWDFNSAMDIVLTEHEIDGRPRKLLLHAPKNGFFYVLDRETGSLVSAEKFARVTWAERIDLETGRPVETPDARYADGYTKIWPGTFGAHNWHPMSFSPDTGLVYIPARDMPGFYDDRSVDLEGWEMTEEDVLGVIGGIVDYTAGGPGDVPANAGEGFLLAWDPVEQREVWRQDRAGVTNSGTLVTAGGLVFQGLAVGHFEAYDARDGRLLWRAPMGVGTQAPPITFEADGRQYVAILAGWGGGPNLLGSLTAQFGWIGRSYTPRLLVYALDGDAALPPTPPPGRPTPIDDPDFEIDPARAQAGAWVYLAKGLCSSCHGYAAVAGGYAPDLRASPVPLSFGSLDAIVRGGERESRGMPRFDEFTAEDVENLQHYLRQRARESLASGKPAQ
ncbi:MAG: PQQ-dependent dehydrogenase, methanol/ethanol family [Deltaproteobacteria bacterium]|jgi:quinohemoprotein ethanol dehydrogenase|nr:PQQ-dependent dehydrogenase, methanol/ethanol family [Deltaproteobacteria bacterium]